MDDPLRDLFKLTTMTIQDLVLILIVMDDPLRVRAKRVYNGQIRVLILIVMDDPLREAALLICISGKDRS